MINGPWVEPLQALLVNNYATYRLRFAHAVCALGAMYAAYKLVQATRRQLKTTALRGPSNPSFIWGMGKALLVSPDPAAEYEKWAEKYGGAYEVPTALGGRRIMLSDPRAIAHVYAGDSWTYVLTPFGEAATLSVVGKGLMSAQGESHRRQRKALAPAFSHTALREMTPVFYDSAYKARNAWDSLIESSTEAGTVIEAQDWMNHISLDTIGMAGFSHDFGSLEGKPTSIMEVFDSFGDHGAKTLNGSLVLLAQALPWLLKFPTSHAKLIQKLNDTMGEISNVLLTKSRHERDAGTLGEREEKSILGLLIRTENQDGQLYITRDEVMAQAKTLLVAGYETTSISLTWALIELSKNLDIQSKLRSELLEFKTDPTYDQLSTGLPYLDAVVHETLRMHPAVPEMARMAAVDDMIPLNKPVRSRSGELVDYISVAKGTLLSVSIPSVNRSTTFWGADAKTFKPERWLSPGGIPASARELRGHQHLLTFIDGPRTCLGKGFAIAEIKIALTVLVKHLVFELRDGPETHIETTRGLLPRPKVAGEEGTAVPLRVRRFE